MKDKIISISFVLFLFYFMILGVITKDQEISKEERRKLTQFKKIELSTIFSYDNYFSYLNDYFTDQFPYRNTFRKIKAIAGTKLFLKNENNNVFEKNGYLFELNTKVNENSINHLLSKINYVSDTYLQNKNKYFVYIPDKNYYLNDLSIPKMDYNLVEKSLKNGLNEDINWIDIKDDLSLDSYYKTDIHWKNEKLEKVVNKIGTKLNFNITFPNINNTYSPFYGSLYARISTNIKADTLNYLTSDIINNASVFNYEKKEIQSVYTQKNLTNVDSYDVFLSGATPLLIINNNMSNNNRELIIFRDSFGSSITPLLIEAYKKITVIDLRYIGSKNLKEIEEISFNSVNDIIFLYSIPVINNSFAIK